MFLGGLLFVVVTADLVLGVIAWFLVVYLVVTVLWVLCWAWVGFVVVDLRWCGLWCLGFVMASRVLGCLVVDDLGLCGLGYVACCELGFKVCCNCCFRGLAWLVGFCCV